MDDLFLKMGLISHSTASNQPRREIFLSIGRLFHKLAVEGDSISVRIFKPRHPYPTATFAYRYRFQVVVDVVVVVVVFVVVDFSLSFC